MMSPSPKRRAQGPKPSLTTIKNRRDFLSANTCGKKFVTNSFILLYLPRADDHPEPKDLARVGYTVTKKMGNAVARNRIKRRLREAARQVLPGQAQPGFDYIFISRQAALERDFSALVRDMGFAFSRINANKVVPK
jgi:ribonuclease P protein component